MVIRVSPGNRPGRVVATMRTGFGCGCPPVELHVPGTLDHDGALAVDADRIEAAVIAHCRGTHRDRLVNP